MKLWLATVGEPLAVDAGGQRLLRTGQFAAWLAERGHDVTFFTGTMDHYQRRLRAGATTTYDIAPNYRIVALAGRLYRRTISLARFRNHADVAKSFRAVAPDLAPPDIVLSSYPTEELCRAILDYAGPRGIPVAIDVRDFWPDIFSEMLPGGLRWLGPIVFRPFDAAAGRTLARADALSGMTESAMRWAARKAGRAPRESDFWFPFSYKPTPRAPGAAVRRDGVKLCFLGTLSRRSNVETLVDAFRLLARRGVDARLTICGSGEGEAGLRQRALGLANVEFTGWVTAERLSQVMAESDLGTLPYDRPDFHMSIPNKFVEYLAGDLPVLACTEGEVRLLLERRKCGIWTEPDAHAIAAAVADIAAQPERLAQMRRVARTVFYDTFEENRVFEHALERLTALAADHGKTGEPA